MKRVSIIGCEQTFAQFKDVILTKRRPSTASLALVGAAACGDTDHHAVQRRAAPVVPDV